MIAPLLATIALSCPGVIMTDPNHVGWAIEDFKHKDYAKTRCPVLFPNSPCVIRFIKTDVQQYRVICGAPRAKSELE